MLLYWLAGMDGYAPQSYRYTNRYDFTGKHSHSPGDSHAVKWFYEHPQLADGYIYFYTQRHITIISYIFGHACAIMDAIFAAHAHLYPQLDANPAFGNVYIFTGSAKQYTNTAQQHTGAAHSYFHRITGTAYSRTSHQCSDHIHPVNQD